MRSTGDGIGSGRRARRGARRWSWSLATTVAMLAGALAASPLGLSPASRDAARPFLHRTHVSTHWYGTGSGAVRDAEYARDCRGCHDQRANSSALPVGQCGVCHFDMRYPGDPEAESGGWIVNVDQDAVAARATGAGNRYDHADHMSLACRECHLPRDDDEDMHVPRATDTGLCLRCHDVEPPRALDLVVSDAEGPGPIDMEQLRERLLDRLNLDPGMKRDGRGPFLHRDHMRPADLASPAKCLECHPGVPSSTAADLADKEFDAGACAACHVGSQGAGVKVAVASRGRANLTASTFEHRDHLRSAPASPANATTESARAIADDGCLACHEHQQTAHAPTYVVRADRTGHAGCVECHDVPRFRTKEHGRWDACVACHDFERVASGPSDARALSMKSNRVEARVLRSEPGAVRFELPAAAHPGLIGQPAENCADCHKAALPAAATRRSRSARFDHAQHVPKDAAPESCAACHLDVAKADGSTRIGVPFSGSVPADLDPASLLTFDPGACTTCHPGIAIDAASLATAEPRTVREFSHAHHMAHATDPARPGATVQCATCHDVATSSRGEPVGTLPRAQDCTMCHVHDADHAEWTGRIHGADVASCAVCHEDRMPGLSFRPAEVASAQVSLSGAQHHPDDRSCAECHLDTVTARAPSPSIVSAGGALFTIHAGNKYPADCRSCHWALPLASLGNQSPTLESRRSEGASLVDFPGGAQADEMRLRFLEGSR